MVTEAPQSLSHSHMLFSQGKRLAGPLTAALPLPGRCHPQRRPGADHALPQESEGLRVDQEQGQLRELGGRGDLQGVG